MSDPQPVSRLATRTNIAIAAFSAGLFVGFLAFNVWPRVRALDEQGRRQAEQMLELQRMRERVEAAEKRAEPPK